MVVALPYCRTALSTSTGSSRSHRQEVLALDGLERFAIDGVEYEAFNTSGVARDLSETLEGKVNELNLQDRSLSGSSLPDGLRSTD
jgi:hypothetical protein